MARPLVWIAAAFVLGIAAGRAGGVPAAGWLCAAMVAVATACGAFVFGRSAAVPLLIAAAATGALWHAVHTGRPLHAALAAALGRDVVLTGTVVRPPQVTRERTRAVVAAEQVTVAGQAARTQGLVLVSIRGSHPIRYGDRLRARGRLVRPPPAGNPGEFSYRDYLAARGVGLILYARGDVRVAGQGHVNPVLRAADAVRRRMTGFYRSALPGERSALIASLLLGDDGAIAPDVRDAFARAGLLHVLVVSGAQVGLVLAAVVWLARAVHAPPAATGAAAAAAVTFFALIAGWVPSVARATVMGLLGLGALSWRRDGDAHTGLALAALILLGSSPLLLFDAGFQLSFAATWALVYVAPVLAARLAAFPPAIRTLVSMTVAAQLSVMPLLAHHFLQVSLVGMVANLVVVPLVAVLVPAGFAVALLGIAVPSVGGPLAFALAPAVDAILSCARWFAAVPFAVIHVGSPSAAGVIGFYAVVVALVEWQRGRLVLRPQTALAGGAVVAALAIWLQVAAAAAPPAMVVTFLDVGQGDGIVVRGPTGRTLLIDAGGEIAGRLSGYDVGARRVVPALRRLGVRYIDVVVLTHPDEDHVGGLPAVLENLPVGLVLDSGTPHPAPSYVRFLHLVESRRIPYRLARQGLRLDLGGGAGGLVLSPPEPPFAGSGADLNLNSVVLRLTYGVVSILLTGDIEAVTETWLLNDGVMLRSTLLKVAHHGSATSSTPAFLAAVAPAAAVISAGALNSFGHPHRATLDALHAAGIAIYRTDHHGAVTAVSTGHRLWMRTVRDASDR